MNYKVFELSIQMSKPYSFNLESLKEIEINQWVKNYYPSDIIHNLYLLEIAKE